MKIEKLRYLLIILFTYFYVGADANVKQFNYDARTTYEAHKWEVVDVVFNSNLKKGNPFTAQFDAHFTGPDGEELQVPGFFNGDNQWVIRFSASKSGVWRFTTSSGMSKLDGKSGQINVKNQTLHDQKGGIVIKEDNPRHFYYEDGSPYFLMAFECDWLFALDYHNDNEAPKTEHLLNLLNENRFNHVVMNVFSYDVNWEKDERLKRYPEHEFGAPDDIFPFLGNNENPDFTALNPVFFQKLDRTISLLHDKNIVSHLMIYVWNKMVNWPDMNSDADNMYYDYVIKRYQGFPNVMWDVSKEALYYGRADDEYILERIDRFRKLNHFNRLLTVHDYGFCKRHPESVDYISRQEWKLALYQDMLEDYNKYTNKPLFNIEHGGYEESPYEVWPGNYINAEYCLRRNYECAFAGVYSTYYWQGASWNIIIHNPFEQPDYFYKPKFEYYKHMVDLFSKYDFSTFKPSPWHNDNGFCLENEDGTYLLYVPKETFQRRGKFLLDKKPLTLQWFNTLTGEYSEKKTLTQQEDFRSPWYEKADAVLIVTSSE